MTNAEAINLLDNLIGFIDDNQGNDYDTALKMGINALKYQNEFEGNVMVMSDGRRISICY